MNLAEALNAALPDLPARRARVGFPRLHPALIFNENIEEGKPVVSALIRGEQGMFTFSPEQWKVIELFDGKRSWEDVARLLEERDGVRYDPDDLREFTSGLEDLDFWYKTSLEKNVALQQKLEAGRHDHAHRKGKIDVAHIQFSAWDPDRYFNLIYPWMKWVYSRGFALFCAALFIFMIGVFVANWGQIGRDTLEFYTFTDKTAADLAEFWILFLILGFFHESAHGLTCKHYGGEVHRMGFHLIFLTPAFFVDVTEAWIYANRWQRLVAVMAGIGIELVFCALATIVWWGTPAGSGAHDLAYKIMLITGAAVVVVNMNPLIKLDGYYAFSEIIGFSDIKEKSTAYLSQLVRTRIFRMPVEVDYVPKRRRPGYVTYAVLSGAYSYGLLLAVVRFSYNVSSKFSPQWGFVPALALALLIFKSRIRTFLKFMQTVYLDKRDRLRSWLTGPRLWLGGAALLLLFVLPLFHETVQARFLLEPLQRAEVRATVPGRVTAVFVKEGERVRAGQLLLRMANPNLESVRAGSVEQFALTGMERTEAQLKHRDLGAALQQHQRAGMDQAVAIEESDQLAPRAPIDGVVTAPRLRDLVGSSIDSGTMITGIADLRVMRARIFVPEFAVGRIYPGARARLLVDGAFAPRSALVTAIQPAAGPLPPALATLRQIRGGANLEYYTADAVLANDGFLSSGMTGTAKIVVRRSSLARMAVRALRDFADRKVW